MAKPSRPSRAYLHLTKPDYLGALSDKVRETTFTDAKASGGDSSLLGPPSVEFAPYGRIPHAKIRKDARQGTIDQDPEFIDFLESLTNPTVKPIPAEVTIEREANKGDAPMVTPLIQYLRDKKNNKGKDPNPATKSIKHARNDSKDSKTNVPSDKRISPKSAKESIPATDKRSATAIKVEKAAREAVKVLNKHAANATRAPAVASSPIGSVPPTPTPTIASPTPAVEKRRERGNVSVAARILQRDLGIGTSPNSRRRRDLITPTGSATTANTTAPNKQSSTAVMPGPQPSGATENVMPSPLPTQSIKTPTPSVDDPNTKPKKSSISSVTPIGPAASRALPKVAASSTNRASTTSTPTKPILSTPSSTQAFLKHANPSQGVTEPLLLDAFAGFGTINKVEIDKKKGFAYVEFADPDGLQKAIKASPVKVAQGQVVVLERKTGSSLQARNARGGGSLIGGRGNAMSTGPRGGSGRGGVSVRGRGGVTRGGSVAVGSMGGSSALATTTTTTTPASSSLAPGVTVSTGRVEGDGGSSSDVSSRQVQPGGSLIPSMPTSSTANPIVHSESLASDVPLIGESD